MNQPDQPGMDSVDAAIAQAKAAEQHLRDVAPDAIDEPEPREDFAEDVSAADDGSESPTAP